MQIHYLFGVLGILLINTSCFQEVERPEQEIINNSIGGSNSYPVFTVSNSTSSSIEPNPQSWDCGTEWIIIKNPDGSYAYLEIVRICDPLQDVYKGCPSPLDN